jgi:cation transport ATPase
MTTQRITLPIDILGCGGSEAHAIEQALAQAPGVVYTYVNPLTEMAYVEFDPTRTTFTQLAEVIERSGYGPSQTERVSVQVTPVYQPAAHHSRRQHMRSQHSPQTSGIGSFFRSPIGMAVLVFLTIAALYLITQHTAHVLGLLPYGLLLLCPFLHLLMHGSHGSHSDHPGQPDHSGLDDHAMHQVSRSEEEQR